MSVTRLMREDLTLSTKQEFVEADEKVEISSASRKDRGKGREQNGIWQEQKNHEIMVFAKCEPVMLLPELCFR